VSARLNLVAAIAVLGLLAGATGAVAKDKKAKEPEAASSTVNPACGTDKLSKQLAKPMAEAQKARESKDWNGMLTKVAEAEAAVGDKTEYDKYWIHELRGIASANLKQNAQAIPDLEAGLNSPCMPEGEEKVRRTKLLMQLAYQDRNYDKAIEFGSKAYKIPGGDPDVGLYLANAYYVKDDFANTRIVMTDVIKTLEANGQTPDEQTLRILQSACIGLKDNQCVMDLVEKLVITHPKPVYWEQLIDSMLRGSKNDNTMLNVLRFADGVEAMTDPSYYIEMAQLAMAAGLPGEAQAILDKGTQKGVFSTARDKEHSARLMGDAKQAAALDKSTLDKQDASARAKPTGEADVKLGAAYLSYGDNAKAIEALQRGIGKGSVKNPDEAALLLAIANLRSGNTAEATKAFGTVSKDPTLSRIAKLWQAKIGGAAG